MYEEFELEQVSDNSNLNDSRTTKEFRVVTFSGYKKTDVKKALLDSLQQTQIENACYWCAELVSAGHYLDIWEFFLLYLGKHINLANPGLVIYLEKRFTVFRNILSKDNYHDELQLRNNPTVRNIFAEVACILAMSPKRLSIESIKIKKDEEFDMVKIQDKLKAPSTEYSDHIFKEGDCKELAIPINELAFELSITDSHIPNMARACYWIEWLVTFDQLCRKRKRNCVISTRDDIPVDYKHKSEAIWLVWDTLFYQIREDKFLLKLMNSLLNIYCIQFTPASIKKKQSILYFAVSIVTESFVRDVPLVKNKEVIQHTLDNLSTIYKQIKKKEIRPSTDYLFFGLHDIS